MSQLHFFALKADLLPVLEAIDAARQLQYVLTGNFESPELMAVLSDAEIPGLGSADSDAAVSCASYLVCERRQSIEVRRVEGRNGRTRYCVDQLANPDTVTFTPAGLFSDEVVLCGRVATAYQTDRTRALMKLFSAAIKARFSKVNAFQVGPAAMAWLDAGKRLTMARQSPPDFDLRDVSRREGSAA